MVRYKSFSLPPNYRHITAKSLSIVLESLRHLHRHSAIISSIIYTFFRDKNKKTPTSQLGGLLQRYFMMEFQIS